MEEARPFVALETDPECLLQRRAHGSKRRGVVSCCLDPREAVAGVGRQQPGQVFRLGQGGPVGQGAAEIFPEPGTDCTGKGARCFQSTCKVFGGGCQPEGFERGRMAVGVFAHQDEIARVGHQHQAVALPIATDLGAVRSQPSVVAGGLDFNDAAFRDLVFFRLASLHLLG